jgi:hypothetical protein
MGHQSLNMVFKVLPFFEININFINSKRMWFEVPSICVYLLILTQNIFPIRVKALNSSRMVPL